ncbi:PorT family protein [Hymenobacter tibetensis]|uniref:PorT family protein n=1 Tax=Hymenobacter tibetensis TaxID=497967 RepID=A0ABY4D0X6_9BACT|nr:porin family protein [Hymenobacter tibetensis]UOG75519.1 PorT family protein [Hymenobacter tibetensis]
MKKFLTLTAAAAVASISFAQAQDAGGFRLGVKVGGTYSNVSGDEVTQITGANYSSKIGDYKIGYNAGLSFSIPLTSDGFFSFAPELLYNRKGYEIETEQKSGLPANIKSVEQEQKRVLHYIDVPLLAKINAGGLFFELGPQVSYLFGSKNKSQTTTKYTDNTKDKVDADGSFLDYSGVARGDSYKSDLAQFDISGVAGVGYMTEGGISLGLRYARGFNSLLDTKDTDNEPKAFNNAFTLQLGYLIPTK